MWREAGGVLGQPEPLRPDIGRVTGRGGACNSHRPSNDMTGTDEPSLPTSLWADLGRTADILWIVPLHRLAYNMGRPQNRLKKTAKSDFVTANAAGNAPTMNLLGRAGGARSPASRPLSNPAGSYPDGAQLVPLPVATSPHGRRASSSELRALGRDHHQSWTTSSRSPRPAACGERPATSRG